MTSGRVFFALFAFFRASAASPEQSSAAAADQGKTAALVDWARLSHGIVPLASRKIIEQLPPQEYPRIAINTAQVNDLPVVDLGYGKYRATKYVKDNDVYVFKNIRFAAPPTGPNRWTRPQPPMTNGAIQDGRYGPSCIQSLSIDNIPAVDPAGLLGFGYMPNVLSTILDRLRPEDLNVGRGGSFKQIADMLRPLLLPGGPLGNFEGSLGDVVDAVLGVLGSDESEDCLFLDVYVPGKVFRKEVSSKLPVFHWFYGGAFVMGSKDGLYNGHSIIEAAKGNAIVVANNYRLGAWGFMPGRTAEQANATNLGLWDQRFALKWTNKFIDLFGGDPNLVTVGGESAGAGSIMHHLSAYGGKVDPLFRRAVIMSPAFQPGMDRDGILEDVYLAFEKAAGCQGRGFKCLLTVPTDILAQANHAVIAQAPPGTFNFGPVADGDLVRQVPLLEFISGNYWKGLESILVSHTSDESYQFVSPNITTPQQLDQYQKRLLPSEASVQRVVQSRFQAFPTVQAQLRDLVLGSGFVCNFRAFLEAFNGRAYSYVFAEGRGAHASDILPTFYSAHSPLSSLAAVANAGIKTIGPRISRRLASFVLYGDPNNPSIVGVDSNPPLKPVRKPADGRQAVYNDVLHIANQESYRPDPTPDKQLCDYWKNVESGVTAFLGYTPPGVTPWTSIQRNGDPSRNYAAR